MRRPQMTLTWKGALGAVLFLTLAGVSMHSALAITHQGAPRKASASAGVKSPGRSASNPAGWWVVTASLNPGDYESVFRGVADISASDIWAVGDSQTKTQTITKALTEHWNGSSWSNVSVPSVGTGENALHAVAADASNDVWAVGDYYNVQDYHTETLTERWNGVQWAVVPSPNVFLSNGMMQDTTLYGVAALASNDVWAVGWYFSSLTAADVEITAHWNGTQWTIAPGAVSSSNTALNAIAAISATNIWAVGGDIEHWNGTQWSVVSSPTPGNSGLMGISALGANNIWAAGQYFDVNAQVQRTLVEHWNGTQWSKVSSIDPADTSNIFYGVAATSDGTVYAVGSQISSTVGGTTGLIEIWNGASWAVQTVPSVATYYWFYATVAFSASDAWAIGFYPPNGNYQTLAEHYQPIYASGAPLPK